MKLARILPLLLLGILSLDAATAGEQAPPKKYGLGFHLGSGTGLSLVGFRGFGSMWETRVFLGIKLDGLGDDPDSVDLGDTVDAYAAGPVFALQERLYFYKGVYAATGITIFPAEIISEVEAEGFGRNATFRETRKDLIVQVPFKLGLQLERSRHASLYFEGGFVSQLTRRGKVRHFPNGLFMARYRHITETAVAGLGLTFNFDDW